MWTILKTHVVKRKCYVIKGKFQKSILKFSCRIQCRTNSLECITQCRRWYTRFCSLANVAIAIRSTSPSSSTPCKFIQQICKVKAELQKKKISQKGSSLKFQQYSKFLNFSVFANQIHYMFFSFICLPKCMQFRLQFSELHNHKESLCLCKQAIVYASKQRLSLYSFFRQKKCVNVEFKFRF